jgi:hypothetical protein
MFKRIIHKFYVLAIVIYILVSAFLYGSVRHPMCMLGRTMNIAPVRIFGQREKDIQVFTFNHPSYMEKFALFEVFGDFCAISRDMEKQLPFANNIMKRLGYILVKPRGGQSTTDRALQYLEKEKKPFLIATSSGIVSNENLPLKLPTIAYRLKKRVQPMVIVYNKLEFMPDTLPKALQVLWNPSPPRVQPHLFFLPAIDPADFSSAEECAQHVRKQMMHVITYWKHCNIAKT